MIFSVLNDKVDKWDGSDPILLDNVQCRGTESSLLQCQHDELYKHNCRHTEDVGIACANCKKHKYIVYIPKLSRDSHYTYVLLIHSCINQCAIQIAIIITRTTEYFSSTLEGYTKYDMSSTLLDER